MFCLRPHNQTQGWELISNLPHSPHCTGKGQTPRVAAWEKEGEPRTKWHAEHFGNPCASVILSCAVHKEVVTGSMRWWTYYCLQGQTWNRSWRQIPGSIRWLKSCFQDFYSLLMQQPTSDPIYKYIYLKKGKKVACRHCLPASSGLKTRKTFRKYTWLFQKQH